MEPPFLFDSCKGARLDGTHVNHELVKNGWCWWYRKLAPGDAVLKKFEVEVRGARRGLWADLHPVPPVGLEEKEEYLASARLNRASSTGFRHFSAMRTGSDNAAKILPSI